MTKSVEELFDGSSFETPEIVDQQHPPPQGSTDVIDPVAPKNDIELPAPKAEGDKPEAQSGKDEGAPPAPEDNDGRDPAFGRIRKERNDYREQLNEARVAKARLEEREAAQSRELETLRAQLQKLQQGVSQDAPQGVPNQHEDPIAYVIHQAQLAGQQAAFMQHLNSTEDALREKEGDEAVDAAVAKFKEMREKNPGLQQALLNARNPYRYMFQAVKKAEAAAEIGDDPSAYIAKVEADARAKYEAEVRAQIAAEAAEAAPAVARARPDLPPSLGRVPNAGGRAAAYTGPAPIEALWDGS